MSLLLFLLLLVLENLTSSVNSKDQTPPTDSFVRGSRFGESQSLRQSHSLDDVLQREEWRDELVALSVSTSLSESEDVTQSDRNDQTQDYCSVYTNYDSSTLAELFLPIQSVYTNVHMDQIEKIDGEELELLSQTAETGDFDLAEFHGPYCSKYKLDGLTKADLKIANSANFAHRPRIGMTDDSDLLRQFVSLGLLIGHEPEKILRLAALYWWMEGSARESIHCLQQLIFLTEDEEQQRNARFMLGQTFALCELFDLAIEALELTAYAHPPLMGPYLVLGGLRGYTGDYERALEDYKQAMELRKKPMDEHQLMAMKYCKCKERELSQLISEQEKLETELAELNAFNDAMERKLQLQFLIQQKSSREREVINGFLAYNYLKHGPVVPGIRCLGTRTEKNREHLSCKIVNPLEFVKAGLRVHDDFQNSLGNMSKHEEFLRDYDAQRRAQEAEYANTMKPFLEKLKPYIGLRMDEPVHPVKYPKMKNQHDSAKREIAELCGTPSSAPAETKPLVIDLNSRGYPVGDLLNKYLDLTPAEIHPLPWDMPYCQPWNLRDEKSGLWRMLKSPHVLWKSPQSYTAESELISVLSDLMQMPSGGDFLLPDFGQRVRTLMKFVSSERRTSVYGEVKEIGPRWLLNELAAMFFRALGLFDEALTCVAENLNGKEPVHSPNVDLALFQLVQMLDHAQSVDGTVEDVALLVKMAVLNQHVDDPAVHLLAAMMTTPEQGLTHLWRAREIDREFEGPTVRLRAYYCKRKLVLGRPIHEFFQPICCWKTEHDVYCFKRPELEGACFKIETRLMDHDRIDHLFRSFRCSGVYVAKSYLPPPIARFVIGFMRSALEIRENEVDEEIEKFRQERNENERKAEAERLKKVFPLDYGGFSMSRIEEFSRMDELKTLESGTDEYVDSDYLKRREERAQDAKRMIDEEADEQENAKKVIRTWDGEIVDFETEGNAGEELPPLNGTEITWHEVVRYDNPLPKKLPRPSSRLYEEGKKVFKVTEQPDLQRRCAQTKLSTLIEPVSTYVSITAKGFNISSVVDLKSPDFAHSNSDPICPHDSKNAIPLFDRMAAYKSRFQFKWYQPEKGLRDALLSLGNSKDTVETIGIRLSAAMDESKRLKGDSNLHWAISTIAALYWRVSGDAVNAIQCLRHSLGNAPNNMKDVAAISLANVYHQAGFLNSALLAGDYAFRASDEKIVAVHFTLANIYTSLNKYDQALQFYYSTLALQSNFQAAKDRVTALHCLI